jgi:uncharacterized protein
MVQVGRINHLQVARKQDFGFYLADGKDDILLPKRFVPDQLKVGDWLDVFVYHDSEGRLIATTQTPKAQVDEIALLTCVSSAGVGAFLDWGLMKDLFVPASKQISKMLPGKTYLVKLYIDEQTGRVAATEKIDQTLQNTDLTVAERDKVELIIYRKTDLGYEVIVNKVHKALLHQNNVFKPLKIGDIHTGFVHKIREDNKIDVQLGEMGAERIQGDAALVLAALEKNGGTLPYHDKTAPETIYQVFGLSKKAFKMAVGGLYKAKKIVLLDDGIKLA